MAEIDNKADTSSSLACSDLPSSRFPFSVDCSAFVNWQFSRLKNATEQAVIFRSLVATMKLQPILNDSLVRKAVKFLVYVTPMDEASADAFLSNFASSSDESLVNFVQSIVVLISSASQTITTAAMEMLDTLIQNCPAKVQLSLIKTDLIPQLMTTLHPLSLSFTEAVDINHYLSVIIRHSLWLATQKGLQQLALEDIDEPEAVHETILKHVLAPSEKYIWHFCVNRFSIVDGGQSCDFLRLVARLLRICPYYEPVTDFILHMPVILTIPSCLTFFESDDTIWTFVLDMHNSLRGWNRPIDEEQQRWKKMHRMLRMEGFEDVIEEKLLNNQNEYDGEWIVVESIEWNNMLGMNLQEQE